LDIGIENWIFKNMGKIKTVIMGDEKAEELARAKAQAKREGKKQLKKSEVETDMAKSAEILKMMASADTAESKSAKEEAAKASKIKAEAKKTVEKEEKAEESPAEKTEEKKSKKEKKGEKKAVHGKKYLESLSLFDKSKTYSPAEAIALVKKTSYSSFVGTVEVHFNVSTKGLRGSVALPHGTGKKVKVAIATDELLEEVATGKVNFDILVAHPSMMPKLAKVAKILGPKGLMPNPKTGTIGENPEELVKKLTAGQVNWKTEPAFPIVHTILGKASFEDKQLTENLAALVKSIDKDKISSIFVKATMGPAIKVIV